MLITVLKKYENYNVINLGILLFNFLFNYVHFIYLKHLYFLLIRKIVSPNISNKSKSIKSFRANHVLYGKIREKLFMFYVISSLRLNLINLVAINKNCS